MVFTSPMLPSAARPLLRALSGPALLLALLPLAYSSSSAGADACEGTGVEAPGGTPKLVCKSNGCSSSCKVLEQLPPPNGSYTVSYCGCLDGSLPICCHAVLVATDGDAPFIDYEGSCEPGLAGCSPGRCQVVKYTTKDEPDVLKQKAKCVPWL